MNCNVRMPEILLKLFVFTQMSAPKLNFWHKSILVGEKWAETGLLLKELYVIFTVTGGKWVECCPKYYDIN